MTRNKLLQRAFTSRSYKFIDRARIRVTGGKGGNGCISYEWLASGSYKKRPDGGHGGNGGSVILVASERHQMTSLYSLKHHYSAQVGGHGSSQAMNGRNGKNCIITVPPGVVVRRILNDDEHVDEETGEVVCSSLEDSSRSYYGDYYMGEDNDSDSEQEEELRRVQRLYQDDDIDKVDDDGMVVREKVYLSDLDTPGSYLVVAKGGRGGRGNNKSYSRSPQGKMRDAIRKQPRPGEVSYLELELKLIGDIGFVGFPNAGKSSLLAAMSKASPKVASYPFTTLEPNIGCIEYKDGFQLLAADIPGLIAGASQGRGRGSDFLRHVERTKALMYIVDAAGVDGRDPVDDLRVLCNEIASYADGDMIHRPAILVANKLDLLESDTLPHVIKGLKSVAQEYGLRIYNDKVLCISAGATGEGLRELSKVMRQVVKDAQRLLKSDTSTIEEHDVFLDICE